MQITDVQMIASYDLTNVIFHLHICNLHTRTSIFNHIKTIFTLYNLYL